MLAIDGVPLTTIVQNVRPEQFAVFVFAFAIALFLVLILMQMTLERIEKKIEQRNSEWVHKTQPLPQCSQEDVKKAQARYTKIMKHSLKKIGSGGKKKR